MINPETVIEALGGIGKTAEVAGVTAQAVSNWKMRGAIPPKHAPALIPAAEKAGLALSYGDFFKAA